MQGAVERAEAQEDEEDTDDEPARRRSASLAGQASGAAGLPTAAAASKLKKPRKQAGEAGGLPGSPGGEARKRKQGAEGGGGASGQAKKPKHVQPIQMPASGGPAPAAVTWAGPLPTSHVMQVPGALPAAAGGVTNSSVSLARLAMTAGQQSASVPPAVEGTINQLMASAQRAPQAGAAAVPPPQEVARAMSILQGLGGAAGAQPASAPPPPPPPAAGGPVDVATQLHLFNSLRDKLSKAIKGKLATAAATAAVARAGGGAGEESDDFRAAPSFTWDIGLQNKLVELVEAYRPVAAAMDGKSAPDADRHIIGDVASMTRIAAQAANVPLAGADSPTQIQGALQHGERRKAAREARKAAAPPAGAALQPATSPSGATTPAGLSQPAAASQPAPVAAPAAAAIGTVATQQQQQAVLASARAPLAFVPAPAAPPPAAGAAAAVAAAPAPAAAPALPYPVPSAEQLAAMRDDILRQAVASGADEATLRADLMSTLPVTSTRHIFLLAVVSSGRAGLSVAEAPARVVELRLDPRWAREKCNYLTQLVGKKGLCNLMHRLKGFRFVSRAFDVSGLELDPGWAARVAKAMAAADEAAAAATGATQQQQPVE